MLDIVRNLPGVNQLGNSGHPEGERSCVCSAGTLIHSEDTDRAQSEVAKATKPSPQTFKERTGSRSAAKGYVSPRRWARDEGPSENRLETSECSQPKNRVLVDTLELRSNWKCPFSLQDAVSLNHFLGLSCTF